MTAGTEHRHAVPLKKTLIFYGQSLFVYPGFGIKSMFFGTMSIFFGTISILFGTMSYVYGTI